MKNIVVLDAGTGNVRSAVRAVQRLGAQVELTADQQTVMAADGLIVPGVGAFDAVLAKIRAVRADRFIERRLSGGMPVLGICVGMQIMFESSHEGEGVSEGLGQWPGTIERLKAPVVPHMGWSHLRPPPHSVLFAGIENERFYFVHSYACISDPCAQMSDSFEQPKVTWAEHGVPFVAAIENGPLCATQFHPEKSGDAGAALLKNWIDSI